VASPSARVAVGVHVAPLKRPGKASVRAVVGWSVADRLEEIGCPALIVAADQDYRPLAEKEACAARMPHAELVVIEDSRHGTTVDQPEAFNAAVLGFLARQG